MRKDYIDISLKTDCAVNVGKIDMKALGQNSDLESVSAFTKANLWVFG